MHSLQLNQTIGLVGNKVYSCYIILYLFSQYKLTTTKIVWHGFSTRGTTGFRISSMVAKILISGILTFINILVKLFIYPYIVNHVIWTALFGIQESLESSQESWNQARNLGILPRFRITSKKIHSVGPLASQPLLICLLKPLTNAEALHTN